MKLLIDAAIMKPTIGGIRTFYSELATALDAVPGVTIEVATSMPEAFPGLPDDRFVKTPCFARSFAGRLIWREFTLGRLARRRNADVVAILSPEAPLRPISTPVVMTVHDTSHLLAPALYGWRSFWRFLTLLPLALRRADVVTAVSEETRTNLHRYFGVPSEDVVVVGNASQTLGAAPVSAPSAGFRFVYIGSLWRHKNLGTLLRAFAEDTLPSEATLAIVGPSTADELAALELELSSLGINERVRHLGYLTPDELTGVLGDSTALVFPSLLEGFGMPVLEAMQRGVPVLSSELPAVRGLASDTVEYVGDPLSPSAWAAAMTNLGSDARRLVQMSEAGIVRGALFSWSDVAQRFLTAAHRASREPGPQG